MNKLELTNLLKSVEQPLHGEPTEGKRAALLPNWEEIEKQNEQAQAVELQKVFNREACAFLGSEFWLYADSLEDAAITKKQLNDMGYINLETFVPKVGHPDDKKQSIPDPDHAFAIRVSSSTDLIFGNHAKKWLAMNKKMIAVVQPHITHTYCHNADACFTFNDKVVAALFTQKLLEFYAPMKEQAEKVNKAFNGVHIALEDNTLDTWKVRLQLKTQ